MKNSPRCTLSQRWEMSPMMSEHQPRPSLPTLVKAVKGLKLRQPTEGPRKSLPAEHGWHCQTGRNAPACSNSNRRNPEAG